MTTEVNQFHNKFPSIETDPLFLLDWTITILIFAQTIFTSSCFKTRDEVNRAVDAYFTKFESTLA